MKELFQMEEFQKYRQRELEAGADFVQGVWQADPQYVRGALDLLSKILRIPEEFGRTPETLKFYQAITSRDFATFEAKFLRKHLGIDAEEGE